MSAGEAVTDCTSLVACCELITDLQAIRMHGQKQLLGNLAATSEIKRDPLNNLHQQNTEGLTGNCQRSHTRPVNWLALLTYLPSCTSTHIFCQATCSPGIRPPNGGSVGIASSCGCGAGGIGGAAGAAGAAGATGAAGGGGGAGAGAGATGGGGAGGEAGGGEGAGSQAVKSGAAAGSSSPGLTYLRSALLGKVFHMEYPMSKPYPKTVATGPAALQVSMAGPGLAPDLAPQSYRPVVAVANQGTGDMEDQRARCAKPC